MDTPMTASGDAPMSVYVINLPPVEPESIADYMAWVKFRTDSLARWIKMDRPDVAPVILETIARIEGDLQQMRHLVKTGKVATERVDEVLAHLSDVV
jgi:hypothetical protein